MLQSPIYVHFRTQWQILGMDSVGHWPEKRLFLDLMNRFNEPPISADFDDFAYRANRCEMAKLRGASDEGGQKFTKFVCGTNEITLVEEWTENSADDFINSSVEMLKVWFGLFPSTAIIAQRCCLRALMQPSTCADSREFLGDRMMRIGPPMKQAFTEMPFKVGFTFTCRRQSGDYSLFIDTTVNSWRDNKRIWSQVEGTYPMEKPMNATNPELAREPFRDCKAFFEEEVIGFLNTYEGKQD